MSFSLAIVQHNGSNWHSDISARKGREMCSILPVRPENGYGTFRKDVDKCLDWNHYESRNILFFWGNFKHIDVHVLEELK